uniref:Uncharacterized protein n=1 Tax=uncultured bacterium Contig248 TaxID=1393544 RepID=W0FIC9_9BACT|nr:hypothetical protein [uncultured bacterium Contig248]
MICTVCPQIFALPLLVEDVPVDLAGRQIRIAVQILVDETLIMPEIQIGLRAVVRHEDFAVL